MLADKLRQAADENLPVGQYVWASSSTSASWSVPPRVTSICAVLISPGLPGGSSSSGGDGGRGGSLLYANDIPVTPGEMLTLVPFGSASLTRAATNEVLLRVSGSGIPDGTYFSSSRYGQGGLGGAGNTAGGGGGGAGGYSGNGGNGAPGNGTPAATPGLGGGGGGGGGSGASASSSYKSPIGGKGGGVGVLGEGSSGAAGTNGTAYTGFVGNPGGPGSGGINEYYGGGGGGNDYYSTTNKGNTNGGFGAIRIIWGPGRAFPSTLTTDQPEVG